MTPSPDAVPRPQVLLSVVSISDYEALIAPREAFLDFLLDPCPTGAAARVTDAPPIAV